MDQNNRSSSSNDRDRHLIGGGPPRPSSGPSNGAPLPMNAAIPRRVPPGQPARSGTNASQRPPPMNAAIPRRASHLAPPPSGSSSQPRHGPSHHHHKQQRPPSAQPYRPPPVEAHHKPPRPQPPKIPARLPPVQPPPGASIKSSIPRKSTSPRAPSLPLSRKSKEKKSHITIVSERPMVIRIKRAGIPLNGGGIPRLRASGRAMKRKRQTYQETDLTDSDDFESEDEAKEETKRRLKKAKGRKLASSPSATSDGLLSITTAGTDMDVVTTDQIYGSTPILAADIIEAPPPGVLPNLWYSREIVLHLFVVDKILGWKTRPVVKLEFSHEEGVLQFLDPVEASTISTKALTTHDIWKNSHKRMEISRTNPTQCPVVLPVAAAKEAAACKKRGPEGNHTPRYTLSSNAGNEREEVLLVKWRGRSYLHCSWERRKDLEKFDPSNSTARHKIRRYLQNQEVAMGPEWKKVLEDTRAAIPDLHPHHPSDPNAAVDLQKPEASAPVVVEEEELFAPEFLEVERILACDENEMNENVLARQRALNIKAEQDAQLRREEEEAKEALLLVSIPPGIRDDAKPGALTVGKKDTTNPTLSALSAFIEQEKEEPWDPEDNVRYVVKWKGLQYSELTWEYWRDIKHDAVDEAEDFWNRQRAPSWDEIKHIVNKPHPHIRDFKKLTKSPNYGTTKRARPVADLGGTTFVTEEDDNDKESDPGLCLRSYQLEGVNWLLFNWWNRRSCILADEMGLGKTIQTVGFLHQLHEMPASNVRGPFLIVAPLSLIGQWQSESQMWAPDMNVVFYHGSADARNFLAKQEFYYTDQFTPKQNAVKLKKQHVTKFHILITTYEVVLKDVAVLSKIRWKALVVDEAHRLKNPKARLFEELASIPRDFCLLLTGTPLQNSTEELWALLHFSDPTAFASRDAFVDKFGQLTDSKQVSDLHSVLRPYLLRRVKEDVEKSLPPKEETILEVALTPIQKTFYKAIYERNTAFLYKGSKPSNAPSLMNVMMELRKCCNHPFLVRGAEERILLDAATALKDKKDEQGQNVPVDYLKLFGEHLVKSSGKMVLLAKLLPKLQSGGHKVLIFSQMVRVLDLLEELLKMNRYRYERLDGSTSAGARSAAVDRFHRKSCQRFVMLLSTRAGGLGLNLTAADTVVIFDSDWNPQNDLQAMARAHRIGQTRSVRVYRLLTAKTYEMHMFHSASMKLGLDRAVLAHQRQQGGDEGEDSKSKGKSERQLQAKEIDELLKKGAYDVFRDDDDKEAQQFMETDIDQLLERSSRKVTYGNTNTSISSGLGSFSKASFVADTGDGEQDVDLDDPNFWEKAVGLEAPVETPEEIAAMLDDGVKRSRKQVQQFDPYAEFAQAEQKKKDKIAMKVKEEKEEKQRRRLEKKQRRMEEKERKRRYRDEARGRLFESSPLEAEEVDDTPVKDGKSSKSKKAKKSDRKKALKRIENEDPMLERLKQAWEFPQRNRVTSAILRVGFGRFCKIRSEATLTSLPIQDLEVFFRQFLFQLSLQASVPLLALLRSSIGDSPDAALRPVIKTWLGARSEREVDWICQSIASVVHMNLEVQNGRRFLRMPLVLAEPSYVADLRRGAALRALRRTALLCRLNLVVEDAVDSILHALGYEELGKRGCTSKNLTTLDIDLKARYVTAEEFSLALTSIMCGKDVHDTAPAVWWDRRCDVALIIGTFVHGFGNYESMRNDEDLPFASLIRRHSRRNDECCRSFLCFEAAARAARKVFDGALDSAKAKQQVEAHEAVAAAMAATKLAEQEEQGPSATNEDVRRAPAPEKETSMNPTNPSLSDKAPSDSPASFDKDDSHYVTLERLSISARNAFRAEALSTRGHTGIKVEKRFDPVNIEDKDEKSLESDDEEFRLPLHHRLPMPDSRVLDDRLLTLLEVIDGDQPAAVDASSHIAWETSSEVSVNERVRSKALVAVFGVSSDLAEEQRRYYRGIGFSGTQCGSSHRSLDDGSDFGVGAASTALVHVASGSDSPRYLRAVGVPMNVTRYCVSGLLYADLPVLHHLLSNENKAISSSNELDVTQDTGLSSSEEKKAVEVKENDPTTKENNDKITLEPTGAGTASTASSLFSDNVNLRAGICAAALHYGYPLSKTESSADGAMLTVYRNGITADSTTRNALFSVENFISIAESLGGSSDAMLPIPDYEALHEYMESVFLPFCVKLCVMGNGPTTRNARGSKGLYETAFGVSLEPEPSLPRQSPIPDPNMPLAENSIEAVACASAILRRVRLLRSIHYITSGSGVSHENLVAFLKSPTMRQQDLMSTFPCWWCPWIHDLGLLVHAATRGLFGILRDRHDAALVHGTVFDGEAVRKHIHDTFVTGKRLPKSLLENRVELEKWINLQASSFPCEHAIERRLAVICAELSVGATNDADRYDNLPMFDHGGWPRN